MEASRRKPQFLRVPTRTRAKPALKQSALPLGAFRKSYPSRRRDRFPCKFFAGKTAVKSVSNWGKKRHHQIGVKHNLGGNSEKRAVINPRDQKQI
jgi:hypothetical protein